MSIEKMVQAAQNGKVADFETAFQHVMADKMVQAVDRIRADVGASVNIDGEENGTGDE